MKNDNVLKKHHFWFLLGVVPLLTLIGVMMINSRVGGKIDERKAALDKANKDAGNLRDVKPKSVIDAAGNVVVQVEKRQGGLHKENWDRQKYLFTWPSNSPKLKRFEQMDLKFGAPLTTADGEFAEFQAKANTVYLPEFSSLIAKDAVGPGTGMADKVAPTQFRGGWQNVLRHVTDWGQAQLTKDQVWLIMEDIWVQRSMLDAVRSVNEEAAAFRRAKTDAAGNTLVDESYDERGNKLVVDANGKPVKNKNNQVTTTATPEGEKLKALFRNRTWAIELEVVKEGTGDQRLTGTLTNLTERLQLMGSNNMMILKVWFSRDTSAQPMYFRIGGEFLPGKGAKKIVKSADGKDEEVRADQIRVEPTADHVIKGGTVTEIVRVEQVLDVRTVPIKRIDALELGKLDSRYAGATLLQPTFFPPEPVAPPADTGTGTPGIGMGPPGSGMGPPGSGSGPPGGIGIPGMPNPGTGPGPSGMPGSGSATKKPGGGPVADVIDGNKKRYLTATAQVRRMPVGMVVVVDQSYLQDVLMAFANSPLRFQITQVTWTRYYPDRHGKLDGTGPAGGTAGQNDYVDFGEGGRSNIKGPADPDTGSSFGPKPPMLPGPGPGPGPLVPGPGPGGSGLGPPPGMGSGFGPPGSGFGPPGSGSNSSTVSESQITSGLVVLSVYGVISLYEKYEAPKTDAATSGPAPGPAPAPMTPNTKMRRRVRA